MKKWLVTGHPKTGTHYACLCLNQLGYKVTHERSMGEDGIVSWILGPGTKDSPTWGIGYDGVTVFENRIIIIRKPVDAISSIVEREQRSEEWRKRFIFIPEGPNAYERAVWSYAEWLRICMLWEPTSIVKTEYFDKWLSIDGPTHKKGSSPLTEDQLLPKLSEYGKLQYDYLQSLYNKAEGGKSA